MYRVEVFLNNGEINTYRNTQKPVYNPNTGILTILFVDISSSVHVNLSSVVQYIVHKESESKLITNTKWSGK